MRILHIITNTDLGGAQRVVIDLCTMAVKDNNTVAVASMKDGPMWSQLPAEVIQYKLPHMVKPIKPLKELPCLFEIKRTIKEFKPDIVHLHSSKAALLGRLACPRKLRKHIVYTVHGFDTIRVRNRIFLPLEKLLQKWCGAIVPVSDYDRKNLISEGITHNIKLIRNAVPDTQPVKESELPESMQKAIKSGKKIVLTIARIALPKRLDIFAETAKILSDKDYAFFWIGSPTDSTLLPQLREYEKRGNVFFTGDIPDASRLIFFADLFVLFSNYEGLPITILEALAKAKPIIASKVGGIPELVDDTNGKLINLTDENGELLPTFLPAKEVAHQIEYYLSEKEVTFSASKCSRSKYEEYFTLDSMWKEYTSLYRILCN